MILLWANYRQISWLNPSKSMFFILLLFKIIFYSLGRSSPLKKLTYSNSFSFRYIFWIYFKFFLYLSKHSVIIFPFSAVGGFVFRVSLMKLWAFLITNLSLLGKVYFLSISLTIWLIRTFSYSMDLYLFCKIRWFCLNN